MWNAGQPESGRVLKIQAGNTNISNRFQQLSKYKVHKAYFEIDYTL